MLRIRGHFITFELTINLNEAWLDASTTKHLSITSWCKTPHTITPIAATVFCGSSFHELFHEIQLQSCSINLFISKITKKWSELFLLSKVAQAISNICCHVATMFIVYVVQIENWNTVNILIKPFSVFYKHRWDQMESQNKKGRKCKKKVSFLSFLWNEKLAFYISCTLSTQILRRIIWHYSRKFSW